MGSCTLTNVWISNMIWVRNTSLTYLSKELYNDRAYLVEVYCAFIGIRFLE
jgi:hypothetical protein